jgi:hypothetical protein
MRRRELLKWTGALPVLLRPWPLWAAAAVELPARVAGVALPHSPLALRANEFVRGNTPDFLYNHSMRTFLFGALLLERERRTFRTEDAFVASLFHDLGLLPAFESPKGPFEVDGADTVERWVTQHGGSKSEANRAWHAVEMHDGRWALTQRQGPEAMLVSLGAAADVDGPDAGTIDARDLEQVLAAFPRLKFKQRFTELLVEHCVRKPDSQRGTWLEGLCRAHSPHPRPDDAVEQEIASAPFAE